MTPDLRQASDRVRLTLGNGSRSAATRSMSATYRAGGTSAAVDLSAYLAARLPATYAAVARVLAEVADLRRDLEPQSLLDVGSGPGTASWAAVDCWPGLSRITLVDNDATFLALAQALAGQGPDALRRANGVTASLDRLPEGLSADLVVAAYALAELPEARAATAARHLWERAGALLVLVEPGTPAGFARVRAARSALLAAGAVPVGPCTHAQGCPLTGSDWCHFAVRLARSRAHMHAKGASVPFEDEKFSWLAVARAGRPAGGARILAPPRHTKAGIDVRLCTPQGLLHRHIARRDASAYKLARKRGWGDLLGLDEESET